MVPTTSHLTPARSVSETQKSAHKTLSDGDSPSVTEIGIDVALEPETVDASTVEASEASAPPTIDGADNLASEPARSASQTQNEAWKRRSRTEIHRASLRSASTSPLSRKR